MKKLFNKILFSILMLFSLVSFVFSDVNPAYTKYENLSDENKSKYGLIPDEFISYYDIKPSNVFTYKRSYKATSILPSSYDLRNVRGSRLITEVKNQNPLGLCWAFSTNSMLESYHLVKNNEYYNFSENAPDYQAQYYGDALSSNSGNSLENAIKYWFLGNGPVTEDHFGSYFTSNIQKNKYDYLDSQNVPVDVLDVTFFKALDMYELKNKYTGANIKNIVTEYNKAIKNHIMNNGAVASGVFMDYMNYNAKFLYNSNYAGSGYNAHAITIIGWDDNFGSVTIDGTTLKGSWIAMNSWGENNYDYFYISYYDADVVTSMVGTTNSKPKSWSNVYFNTNSLNSSYDYNENTVDYVVNKGSNIELIDSIKIYYRHTTEINLNVTISDGVNTYDLGEKTISKGLYSFELEDKYLETDKIYITLSGENVLKVYPYIYVGIYTENFNSNASLELYGKDSNSFQNSVGNIMHFNVVTKNIDSVSNYTVKVYDSNDKDVSGYFDITLKKELVNGYSYFTIKQNKLITGNMISIKAKISSLEDTINYYIQGNGTMESPYIISNSSDMYLLRNYSGSYFKLGNDIDMIYDSGYIKGKYYNNGTGWLGNNFNGVLDGNGYKISNLISYSGGLFNTVKDATIKNLHINGFFVDASKISGLIGSSLSGNNTISNIYVSESGISSNIGVGGLFGTIYGGTIKNIHIKDSTFISSTNVGGVASYINSSSQDITISNVYLDSSAILTDKGGVAGQIIGNVDSSKNKILIQNSRINLVSYDNFVSPTDIFGTKVNSSNISLKDNVILSDEDKTKKEKFNNYDFNNIWGYDGVVYLKLFNEKDSKYIPEVDIDFDRYILDGNIVYNIMPMTTMNEFVKDMIIDDELVYKIYNISGKLLSSNDFVGTGSYIIVSNGLKTKTYDISIYGDVSGDGKVSIKDVYMIADYSVASEKDKKLLLPNTVQLIAADVNKDNKISIGDVFRVADFAINPKGGF